MKNRKLILLLAGIMVVMSVSGCSNKKEETPTETESTETVSGNDTETEETEKDELDVFLTDEEISMDDLVAAVELCDYDKIEVDVTYKEVSEDDVTKEMNEYLSFFDSYEHVMEGTIEEGSTANVTFVGKMDGKEFDGGSGTFDLEIGSNSFIEGFEEGLIGKNVGDEVTLNLTFPSDYFAEEFRDKEAEFDVTINYLLGDKIEAELTDEYLSANTDYATVEELHNAAKEYLENVAYNDYVVERENKVLDYLIQNSKVPLIPRSMINDYIDNMNTYYTSMAEMYDMELEEFLDSYMGISYEEFVPDTKKSAINYMQSSIVLKAIALKENIEISDEEYNAYLEDFATNNGYENADDLKTALEENDEVDEMKEEVLFNKVMKMIYEKNSMDVEPPVSTEIETNSEEVENPATTETETQSESESETEIETENNAQTQPKTD